MDGAITIVLTYCCECDDF